MPAQRLIGALDNDVSVAVRKFLNDGVPRDVTSLYSALQRSNSSLRRQRKNILEASIERVLISIEDQHRDQQDSEAEIEINMPPVADPTSDLLNKSLRSNLASRPMDGVEPSKKRKLEGSQKRQKPSESTKITVRFSLSDIGGMDEVVEQLEELIILPLQYPELYRELHIPPSKGVLLHGPPGCGKTMIARAFAAELGRPFIEILGPSIVSGMSGESEKGIRDKFEEAKRSAPCIIFIDEIDAIAPKRDSSGSGMEKRIVAQLLVSMDELNSDPDRAVVVLAATNRPDSIDPALRRGGRFGSEINISVPNERVRKKILQVQTRKVPIGKDVDFDELARRTAGFVGSDLHELVSKASLRKLKHCRHALKQDAVDHGLCPADEDNDSAAISAARRLIARSKRPDLPLPISLQSITIGMEEFSVAISAIIPSSKREGFATVPNVSWKDIGALKSVREELQSAIVEPIQKPDSYKKFNLPTYSGVLLWGPPGCGKTLLAKAVAAESQANFISIKGPELLNKFVGESEAAVRRVFTRARSSVPCVIFFDELDSLVPRRDEAGSEASARVVNTLLTELDGVGDREGIHVIAATNRPDMIDEAMLRPGRLGTKLFVDLPGPEERVDIFRTLARTHSCIVTPDIETVVRGCDSFSGADLGLLLHSAVSNAIKQRHDAVVLEDINEALKRVKGSVKDINKYRQLKARFGQV